MIEPLPSPKTKEELVEVIDKAIAEGTDYNTSAEALVTCSVAAFNYAAHMVGATGFQAGYASLKAYGELMNMDGPFAVIDGSQLLYPQYNIEAKVKAWLREWTEWARESARAHLKTADPGVHPDVRRRWEQLAAGVSYDDLT